jgi:hypothetical protein
MRPVALAAGFNEFRDCRGPSTDFCENLSLEIVAQREFHEERFLSGSLTKHEIENWLVMTYRE